ncbi:hypothetical protein FGO68_gene10134 [Halteria grandinella]|uniref:Uncharacterized protein n=1 Tax=Halteria grandinella TaxID=5974 RepID=A0A8J8T5V1_HALGN|nr:hypothetical protein FGO68_gene10134 [Halteria grandinella]
MVQDDLVRPIQLQKKDYQIYLNTHTNESERQLTNASNQGHITTEVRRVNFILPPEYDESVSEPTKGVSKTQLSLNQLIMAQNHMYKVDSKKGSQPASSKTPYYATPSVTQIQKSQSTQSLKQKPATLGISGKYPTIPSSATSLGHTISAPLASNSSAQALKPYQSKSKKSIMMNESLNSQASCEPQKNYFAKTTSLSHYNTNRDYHRQTLEPQIVRQELARIQKTTSSSGAKKKSSISRTGALYKGSIDMISQIDGSSSIVGTEKASSIISPQSSSKARSIILQLNGQQQVPKNKLIFSPSLDCKVEKLKVKAQTLQETSVNNTFSSNNNQGLKRQNEFIAQSNKLHKVSKFEEHNSPKAFANAYKKYRPNILRPQSSTAKGHIMPVPTCQLQITAAGSIVSSDIAIISQESSTEKFYKSHAKQAKVLSQANQNAGGYKAYLKQAKQSMNQKVKIVSKGESKNSLDRNSSLQQENEVEIYKAQVNHLKELLQQKEERIKALEAKLADKGKSKLKKQVSFDGLKTASSGGHTPVASAGAKQLHMPYQQLVNHIKGSIQYDVQELKETFSPKNASAALTQQKRIPPNQPRSARGLIHTQATNLLSLHLPIEGSRSNLKRVQSLETLSNKRDFSSHHSSLLSGGRRENLRYKKELSVEDEENDGVYTLEENQILYHSAQVAITQKISDTPINMKEQLDMIKERVKRFLGGYQSHVMVLQQRGQY